MGPYMDYSLLSGFDMAFRVSRGWHFLPLSLQAFGLITLTFQGGGPKLVLVENKLDRPMEHEMETGLIWGLMTVYCNITVPCWGTMNNRAHWNGDHEGATFFP